ncbi:MAG TPA: Ig-like domain-containing protein [Bacteroidia bacterium]|jgi:hypothetical protein|nr:Ig-like domain-containing protein [Bacteroidia bacterium]
MNRKFSLFKATSRLRSKHFKQFISICLFGILSSSLSAQVRRDLNSLTAAERSTLVTLMQQYITSDVVEDHCNYQRKTGVSTLDIHSDTHFLPFHRAYIEGMEDYLMKQGYPQFVPLPSWNPATPVPTEFRVVDANCATASVNCNMNVTNTPSTDCSTSINWSPNIARPRYLSLPVQTGTSNDLCDWPFVTGSGGLSRIAEGETPNTPNSTYHNSVHTSMGGAMRYFTSPGAPIFFCWHAYIDDIWKQYQCSCTNGGGKAVDLYMKDTPKIPYAERDGGNEPNSDTGPMNVSTDIWVRNQNDGLSIYDNQNPIYSKANYVYVRVRNRGCQSTTGNEQLRLHWGKANTAQTWPGFWDGTGSSPLMGNVITTVNIPVIAAGKSTVIEIQWTPPNPADYSSNSSPALFSLLARIIASNDPMATAEGSNVTTNIRNNNNIVSKNVTVAIPPNALPLVNITSPANGSTLAIAPSIILQADASDTDGSITKVEFYQGTTLLGTDSEGPYSYNWTNAALGTYSLTAKAYDNNNAVTTSAAANITVNEDGNAAPVVSITSPAGGTTFKVPATITITASATDSDGTIDSVEFYAGTIRLGAATTSPYSITLTNVAVGNYSYTAKAIDNLQRSTTSQTVAVTVKNNTAPTVALTSPASGASFARPANITVSATAADADGTIARVEFYAGTTLIGTDNTSPYSITWSNVQASSYTLTAKAFDNDGVSTTSASRSITVTGNNPPTVSITSPTNNATFTIPVNITITANAADLGGSVSRVSFYRGSTLISTDNTAPYSAVWSNVPAGTYTLTARATDNLSVTTTSAAVTIIVRTNKTVEVVDLAPTNETSQVNMSEDTK